MKLLNSDVGSVSFGYRSGSIPFIFFGDLDSDPGLTSGMDPGTKIKLIRFQANDSNPDADPRKILFMMLKRFKFWGTFLPSIRFTNNFFIGEIRIRV